MAKDWKQEAKALGEGWRQAQQTLGIKEIDSRKEYNDIKNWMKDNPNSGGKSEADKAAAQTLANQAPTIQTLGEGNNKFYYADIPGDTAATVSSLTNAQAEANALIRDTLVANTSLTLKDRDNTIRATESSNQLEGTRLQSDAQVRANQLIADATRFSATEGARAAIQSQTIASQSQEKQIGLKGAQDRLLAVEQGSQERLNIAATGTEQRRTQAQLLASQEKQIGLTGEQQRLTAAETGRQERLTVGATGEQQRLTQGQLLAGQERQIQLTGAEQRMLAQEQGRQQRETDLQTETFRRYKEAKDAAQASRAFRA